MGAAIGRWDAKYQYWRRLQEKFREFNASTKAGQNLPPLDRLVEDTV